MKLIDLVHKFVSSNASPEETPEGFCPNCWGRQEYGGKFYEAVKHEHITVDNITDKVGWIQAYAVENLKGIELEKNDNGSTCPGCQITYE